MDEETEAILGDTVIELDCVSSETGEIDGCLVSDGIFVSSVALLSVVPGDRAVGTSVL